jgi:hypothetical protein
MKRVKALMAHVSSHGMHHDGDEYEEHDDAAADKAKRGLVEIVEQGAPENKKSNLIAKKDTLK